MSDSGAVLTHVAGTFLIQADGAFLNGAGLGEGEDRNVTVPKMFRDGKNQVPYVSAQAWKRWLRATTIQEVGWPASEPQAIGWNPKGNVNKIAGQINPVEFPEDDIFGYMWAQEGQGRRRGRDEDETDDGELTEDGKTKAVMRASPFAASLLVSLRSSGWQGTDEGFVHLTKFDPKELAEAEVERFLNAISKGRERTDKSKDVWKRLESAVDQAFAATVKTAVERLNLDELRSLLRDKARVLRDGHDVAFIENPMSPLPYTTRFYNTNLQGVFCLDYSRLGVFWNLGDRVELEPSKVTRFLKGGVIEDVTLLEPYSILSQKGSLGRIYRLKDGDKVRKLRAATLLNSLAVLRGGAKQAQFGTDVAPKALILAGLNCGNPVFNHLFKDEGMGPWLKVDTFREVLQDYADRIVTPVLVGVRSGYLVNEQEVRSLEGEVVNGVKVQVVTPIDAARQMGELLP